MIGLAIDLATKFAPYVDEQFKNESKRDLLTNQDFDWTGADTIAVLVEDAARQAQQAIAPALSTLREIVEDTDENAQARISAARSILEYSMKLTETTDILARLDELEAAMGGEHG